MKYLKFRPTYRLIQKIDDYMIRAQVLSNTSPEFQEFYIAMTEHRLNRLAKLTESGRRSI